MIPTHKNQAYQYIRQMMLTGDLIPGSRLSDLALSKAIGISRAPIREAFGRLESEGLVKQIPHYGTFVSKLTRKELADLYDLRILLETDAVAKCAAVADKALARQLDANCDLLADYIRSQAGLDAPQAFSTLLHQLIKWDFEFHMRIIESAGNQAITTIATNSRVIINLMSHNHLVPASSGKDIGRYSLRDHRRIAKAIRKGDAPAARQAMLEHIESAKLRVLARYRDDDGAEGIEPSNQA